VRRVATIGPAVTLVGVVALARYWPRRGKPADNNR
jgi:hypothetical protein